jgi:hypothetical protein
MYETRKREQKRSITYNEETCQHLAYSESTPGFLTSSNDFYVQYFFNQIIIITSRH